MANDDRILLNLVLNEATVSAVEGRVRNLVNRLNNTSISLNINGRNLDNIVNRLNDIQQRMQTINSTPVNINANLTSAQQQYRLETERMRVAQQLELSRQRTLQTENQAISALAQQNRTLTVNNNVTHQIEQGAQNIGHNMTVAGGHARDFVDYLSDGVRYLVTYRSLYAIMNQIGEAFSEMKNVDTAAIQVRKTTGMSKDEIEAIKKSSYGVATEYGRSASEYLKSVSEFARAGYKQHSTELGKLSLLTQNVGDISAESADKMLLAVDAAYQLEGNVTELTNVVNALNNIANKNPTSMQKMADGLQVSASMAKTAGMDISELTALIGTGTAVTQREGAEVARAIRTIVMNVKSVKGELEDGTIIDDESIAKAEAALKGVGISTKEVVNGVRELRNPMEVLDELSNKWHTLGTEAKSVLTESIANKRQANVLSGILDNWSMVEKMQSEYFNSANSAIEENILYLEGWEAKSKVVSAKWTEYVSNLADTKVITGSLDALFGVISVLDTPLGRVATQIVLINTALALSGRLWAAIRARSIVADILSMGIAERSLGTAIGLVTEHLGRQALAWATSPFGVATIAVSGISLLISGISKYNEKLEESRQEMIETGKETAQLTKDLDGLVEEYSKLGTDGKFDNSDREQAKNIQEQINGLLGDEVGNINLANGKYEDQLKLLRDIQYEKAKEKNYDLETAYTSSKESLLYKADNVGVGAWAADSEVEAIKNLKSELKDMDKYFHVYDATGNGDANSAFFKVDTSSAEAVVESYEKMVEVKRVLEDSHHDEIQAGGALEDFYNNLKDEINDLSDAVTKYKDAMSSYNVNQAVIMFNEQTFEGLSEEFEGLTFATVETEDQLLALMTAMINLDGVSDDIKYNIIGLARTNYPEMSKAIDDATAKFVRGEIATGNFKGSLASVASQCGMATKDLATMILKMINLNETKLNLSQQISEILKLRAAMDMSDIKGSDIYEAGGKWVGKDKYLLDGKEYTYNEAIRKVAYDKTMEEVNKLGGGDTSDTPPYTSSSDKDKDKTNEVLDNYLKDAENRYKIHQDELRYIKELQYAKDNLTINDKERLEIAGKINEAYRALADNRIKDLEHQNELLLAQGKTEYDLISNYRQMQDVLHAEAERLRGQGYDDNSNEIQDLQSKWLDYDKKILDADLENSKKWIEARKNYGDWSSWGDSEVEAWGRVLKRLREEYPNAVKEIAEIEAEYRDSVLDGISRYYEDQIEQLEKKNELIKEGIELEKSQWESLLTLQQKYFDNANFVEDTKADIKKELDASMAMYKYLDEDTRKLLFNEDDYIALSDALDKLDAENEKLKTDYKNDIWSATAETIAEVTQHYEHQFELKQKEYEILKASLDVEKKRTELNNVLNERNTKMFINGAWTWVANVEDVKNAQEALADAELAEAQAKRDKEQTLANQELEAHIARLETQEKFLDKELKEAQDKWDEIQKSLEDPVADITDILKDVAENGTPQLKSIIDDISISLNGLNKSLGNATNIGSPSNSGSGSSREPSSSGGFPSSNLPSSGYGSTSDGKWVDAYIPGSGNTSVWVDKNGKTQTSVPVGTVITTEDGRNYKVDGGSTGNYSSTEITKAEFNKIKNGKIFDSGGVASGKGLLAKAIGDEEIVLPPHLTKLILSPEHNDNFNNLVKGLECFYNFPNVNTTTLPPFVQKTSNITYDNRTYNNIKGITLSPQESEALSSVLSRIIPNH